MFKEKLFGFFTKPDRPKAEQETKPEKTKEQLLEEFKSSLEKYGAKDIECRLEQGRLIIEQKLGAGIRGLGYDKNEQSLWLCLDQTDPETIEENQKWNANTVLDLEKQLPGITMELVDDKSARIKITADHPAAALARLLNKEKLVTLPGQYNNWQRSHDQAFTLNEETGDLENVIEWNGSQTECKVAIIDMPCDWQSGKWKDEAAQKLEAELGE